MSIQLHIGQCGNQLGAAYWLLASASSELHEENRKRDGPVVNKHSCRMSGVPIVALKGSKTRASLSRHLFHPSSGAARCILVDSEPKVIQSVIENATDGVTGFQPACTHVEQAGRGNNWAMGYYGPRQKAPASAFTSLGLDGRRELVELVMDSVQSEIESVDCYQGSVVMHSLGGGTGSGLGCRVLENLRDTYPKAYIVTASVAPSYTHGDTPLQNYNAILTLRCLQEIADAVIYKENDDLLRTARYWKALVQERAGTDCTNQRVSLDEINSMAAADLAGLLFPVDVGEVDSARPFDFGKLLHDVCPMPTAKMLDVRSGVWRGRVGSGVRSKLPSKTSVAKGVSSAALFHAPVVAESRSLSLRHGQTDGTDASLEMVEKLVQQACGAFPRTYNTVMASSTVVRGFIPATCDRDRFSEKLGGSIHTAFPPVPWLTGMPQAALTYSSSEPFPTLQGKASATICVNNGNFLASTKRFLERAQRQFHAGAYIHWYKQHGIEDGDFETAFTECATLISEYEALLR